MSLFLLEWHEAWNYYFCSQILFQHNKGKTIKLPGTLQPLPCPSFFWTDVSMDFITHLPNSSNKYVIMVVVDIFSKYTHFCALPHPFTPTLVAHIFMDQIFKLHGMPTSIVYG